MQLDALKSQIMTVLMMKSNDPLHKQTPYETIITMVWSMVLVMCLDHMFTFIQWTAMLSKQRIELYLKNTTNKLQLNTSVKHLDKCEKSASIIFDRNYTDPLQTNNVQDASIEITEAVLDYVSNHVDTKQVRYRTTYIVNTKEIIEIDNDVFIVVRHFQEDQQQCTPRQVVSSRPAPSSARRTTHRAF